MRSPPGYRCAGLTHFAASASGKGTHAPAVARTRRQTLYPSGFIFAALLFCFAAAPSGALAATANVTKSADVPDGSVAFGETFWYTINYACSALTEAVCEDAELTDVLPVGVELVNAVGNANATPTVISNPPNPPTVRFDFDYSAEPDVDNAGDIPDGTTTQVRIQVKLQEAIDAGITELANTADLTIANGTNGSDTLTLAVDPPPDPVWTVSKTVNGGSDPVQLVTDASYEIKLCLTDGFGTLTGIQVVDTLPDAVDPADVANISDGGVLAGTNPSTITWALPDDLAYELPLPVCKSLTYTVVYPDDDADDAWDRAPAETSVTNDGQVTGNDRPDISGAHTSDPGYSVNR